MKTKTNILILCAFLFTISIWGQEKSKTKSSSNGSETMININRDIKLENASKKEEIEISVIENSLKFDLIISSTLQSGKLTIELYDPENNKQANFSIGTQLESDKKETVNGNIRKSLNDPIPGNWIIKIIPAKASGRINIRTNLFSDYAITAPTEFTPDGDGINDVFTLKTNSIAEIIKFEIFNKFGKQVFSTNKMNEGWDGKFEGKPQEDDTYIYIVKAKTISGSDVVQNGHVILSRK